MENVLGSLLKPSERERERDSERESERVMKEASSSVKKP